MILFKHEHLKDEFDQLDPRLKTILYYICGFASNEFYKDITITGLLRSQAQQDAIYALNLNYQKSPWLSVHQFMRGADVSTRNLSEDEVLILTEMLNFMFHYSPGKKTALYHDVGLGAHLHLQVPGKSVSIFY